jgi:hypothetical protein
MDTQQLMRLVAPALATMALAAGPAYATTIAEVGDATATERGAFNIDNGFMSITCSSSDTQWTFQNSGAVSLDGLAVSGGCMEGITGLACVVTVTSLPQSAQIEFVSANRGDLVFTGPPFLSFTVDCGAMTCTAQTDDRVTGVVIGGASPRIEVVDQPVAIGGDAGCGVGIDGNLNVSWTVNSTANGTDTTLTITA